jgi:hypothetical protein
VAGDVLGALVIRTASGGQMVNAFTGPADQARQSAQWQ